MLAFATLSGPIPKLGVIAVALLAAVVILARENRARAWAMAGALILAPTLLLAAIWNSSQLHVVHRHPLEAVIGGAVAVVVLALVGVRLARRIELVAPLAVATLPFRVPISAGGRTSNLLVALYLVVGAAALGWVINTLRDEGKPIVRPPSHWFERLLAGFVVLYAVQACYSVDFVQALQNIVFFYVPFALLLALLRDLRWDRTLLTRCLGATVALALIFSCIGFVEEATGHLLLNPKLIAANDVHPYFTVNSVFYDPDIFGRYLALVMILVVAVLITDGRRRVQLGSTAVLGILWTCLVFTLSRSSLAALLAGMAVLAAARWRVKPVLITLAAVIVAGAVALAVTPKTFGLNQGLNGASSGRANLITGGVSMFGDRPVWGYGSAGFSTEYGRQNRIAPGGLTASHTIPVTIAAEQGLIGLLVYIALVAAAIKALSAGSRRDPVRLALLAAFLALMLHTLLYADFLEDPVTWTLMAVGGALATGYQEQREAERREERRRRLEGAASVSAT